MSKLKEMIEQLRELGPGNIMILLGGVIFMGVLTMYGEVYAGNRGGNIPVHVVAAVAVVLTIALVIGGFVYVPQSKDGNLLKEGMIGRRFLEGDDVMLTRIKNAKSITIMKTWFPETEDIENALKDALHDGANIKLILCKPGSDVLNIRCEGAGVTPREARRWIIRGLNMVQDKTKNNKKFKGVAFHEEWPGCPVIRADKKIYMGFYFIGTTSPHAPWIEIRPNSKLGRHLKDQEEKLWQSAKNKKTLLEDSKALEDWLGHKDQTKDVQ